MDIHQLETFLAVVREGSFSGAAKGLGRTQPAVSQVIGRLEDELGQRLFERPGRHGGLTDAGKALVEYAERLPASFKVRYGQRKWLHRRVSEGFLPETILKRKKRGFAVNIVDEWFQNSLSNNMNDHLLDSTSLMFQFLNPETVRQLLEEHRSGKSDNHKMLFSLVVLEEWLRTNQSANSHGVV